MNWLDLKFSKKGAPPAPESAPRPAGPEPRAQGPARQPRPAPDRGAGGPAARRHPAAADPLVLGPVTCSRRRRTAARRGSCCGSWAAAATRPGGCTLSCGRRCRSALPASRCMARGSGTTPIGAGRPRAAGARLPARSLAPLGPPAPRCGPVPQSGRPAAALSARPRGRPGLSGPQGPGQEA